MPGDVRRAVHARDGEQCAFVSEAGDRCGERGFLEFDHVIPFARGGEPTVPNTRLLCAAHNQHAADRSFGAAFMEQRRAQADLDAEVLLGLRGLGWASVDARDAVARSAHPPTATLEDRLRAAMAVLRSRCSETASGPRWQASVACAAA